MTTTATTKYRELRPGQRWQFRSAAGVLTTYEVLDAEPAETIGALVRLRNPQTEGIAHITQRTLYTEQPPDRSGWRFVREPDGDEEIEQAITYATEARR